MTAVFADSSASSPGSSPKLPFTPKMHHDSMFFRQHHLPLTPPRSPPRLSFEIDPKKPTTALYSPPCLSADETGSRSFATNVKRDIQERQLTDNEVSYYLPSRADGVNDMYLRHEFSGPVDLEYEDRIPLIWAYLLFKHPLLASRIESTSHSDIRFAHDRPTSVFEAVEKALDRFSAHDGAADLLNAYLNGPRTLSSSRLSFLIFNNASPEIDSETSSDSEGEAILGRYELILCAAHFIGDGMALHTFMNEFYTLLGSNVDLDGLVEMIKDALVVDVEIPLGMEDKLPCVGPKAIMRAVQVDDYDRNQRKCIGGQTFPSASPTGGRTVGRETVVPTVAYNESDGKALLVKCKAQGVTVAHLIFALCNIAWTRIAGNSAEPCMMYSALNMRPSLAPSSDPRQSSYFHLAVGYYNITLPSLIPNDLSTEQLLWYRAQITKKQTVKAVKSPFLVSRAREETVRRAARARHWAKVDDEAAAAAAAATLKLSSKTMPMIPTTPVSKTRIPITTIMPLTPPTTPRPADTEVCPPSVQKLPETPAKESKPKSTTPAASGGAQQKALMGLSMLGNLDGIYRHDKFGPIQLESLMTGSRQRKGGLLLFSYTFRGKLYLSLGYDRNGFKDGIIEEFWNNVNSMIAEVLNN